MNTNLLKKYRKQFLLLLFFTLNISINFTQNRLTVGVQQSFAQEGYWDSGSDFVNYFLNTTNYQEGTFFYNGDNTWSYCPDCAAHVNLDEIIIYGVNMSNTPVNLNTSDMWLSIPTNTLPEWSYWDYTWETWQLYTPIYTPPTDMNTEGWSSLDMYTHYLNGGGDVTLSQMGLLDAVKNFNVTLTALSNFDQQIYDYAALMVAESPVGTYSFEVSFQRSYEFEDLKFAFGGATLSGDFSGVVTVNGDGTFTYGGNASISFHDYFTDPYDTFDLIPGEWNPDGTPYSIDGNWNVNYTNAN